MLFRILLIAFLLLPCHASWYPKARVSCASDYERESRPPAPPPVTTKTPTVDIQGYRNIIIFGLVVTTVLTLLYTVKNRYPNVLFKLFHCFKNRYRRIMLDKVIQEDNATVSESVEATSEPLMSTSAPRFTPSAHTPLSTYSPQPPHTKPAQPPAVHPPQPPSTNPPPLSIQPPTHRIPPHWISSDGNTGEGIFLDRVNGPLQPPATEEALPNGSVWENSPENFVTNTSLSAEVNEVQRPAEIPPSLLQEADMKQSLPEPPQRVKIAEVIESKEPTFVVSKSKLSETKPSAAKGSSITRLSQKTTKNCSVTQKPLEQKREATPTLQKERKQSTESFFIKKQVKKECVGAVKKQEPVAPVPCKCSSIPSVEKMEKEAEVLRKRFTSLEKTKRDAVRSSEILQKGMNSLKSALKATTDENAKLKKQLEAAKKEKTEAIRRTTMKWREKLKQLEEKMRMDSEEASNKAESVSSNGVANVGRSKQDVEETAKAAPTDLHCERLRSEVRSRGKVADGEEMPGKRGRGVLQVLIPRVGVDVVKYEETEAQADDKHEETGTKIEESETRFEEGKDEVGLPVREDQLDGKEHAGYADAVGEDSETHAAMADVYPREDEWQEKDYESSSQHGDGSATLREIISEAVASLDIFKATEALGGPENIKYQGNVSPLNTVHHHGKEELGEVTDKMLDLEEQTVNDIEREEMERVIAITDLLAKSSRIDPRGTAIPSVYEPVPIDATTPNSNENETELSFTEINHKGGRFLRLKSGSKESNTCVENQSNKKTQTSESSQSKIENVLSVSKNKLNVVKSGVIPKLSDKICTTKPPVPKPITRTTAGVVGEQSCTDQVQFTQPHYSKNGSLAKLLTSITIDVPDDTKTKSEESEKKLTNECPERDNEAVYDEDKSHTEKNSEVENSITEIFHSTWVALEEENRRNVADDAVRAKGQISAEAKQKTDPHFGSIVIDADETEHLVKEMTASVGESEKALEERDEGLENFANTIDEYDSPSVSETELEARKCIMDLMDSCTLSQEEKEIVEALLGQYSSGCGLLQSQSSTVSAGGPSAFCTSSKSDNSAASNGRASSTLTEIVLSTGMHRVRVGASESLDSAQSYRKGFLTEALKQCFINDPKMFTYQNKGTLKDYLETMGSAQEEEPKSIF